MMTIKWITGIIDENEQSTAQSIPTNENTMQIIETNKLQDTIRSYLQSRNKKEIQQAGYINK